MRFLYSIKNLRGLELTPSIEIRPITILLGRNSVGKSTFLRSFPLLRQSIETRSSAPVLWYGDYVDFGDYRSAVSQQDTKRQIELNFRIVEHQTMMPAETASQMRTQMFRRRPQHIRIEEAVLNYKIKSKDGDTVRSGISLSLPNLGMELALSFAEQNDVADRLEINGRSILELIPNAAILMATNGVFSEPMFLSKTASENYSWVSRERIWVQLVESRLKKFSDNRIRSEKITREAYRILKYKVLDSEALESLSRGTLVTFSKLYKGMRNGFNPSALQFFNDICSAQHLFNVLHALGACLEGHFSAVEYIGPARARSERYYRRQELEVSDISPDGHNLPIFLASLSSADMEDFSSWVVRTFNYGVKVEKSEGHISIVLVESGNKINVVDTGYGVSQVLPVLAQIWWMQRKLLTARSRVSYQSLDRRTLAIEQPELHLHPAHQARLADVFAEYVGKVELPGSSINFMIETHSEALINRLGELISVGKLSAEDVQIVIFDSQPSGPSAQRISVAEFDKEGVLQNWPFGFFNYP